MNKWTEEVYSESLTFTTPLPRFDFLLSLPKETEILDVGCGYGRTISFLSDMGFERLSGFDLSPSYVSKAQASCPRANIYVADIGNFRSSKRYDLILLMGVIEYVLTDREQKNMFEKLAQGLSDKGVVFIETFTIDLKSNWKDYLRGFFKAFHWGRFRNSKGFECHHQSVATLKKMLKRHFVTESLTPRDFPTWTNNVCRGYEFVLKRRK